MEEPLTHSGVLGMKWGVRKENESAYRAKLSKIQGNKNINASDAKRFKYRNQSAAARITKTAASATAKVVVKEAFQKYLLGKQITKKDILRDITGIAISTASQVAIQDALAKSASKRYTNSGKRQPGTKDRILTKEDLIQTGIGVGVKAAYVGVAVGGLKMAQVRAARQANEDQFNAWGRNILPQTVDNVIWSNDDMAIIDNRRR